MSEGNKYYYMRLKEDFFDTPDIKIIQKMPDGYLYSDILLKMYLVSLRAEGRLMVNNIIPYSPDMIATVTGHQIGTVERALKIFQSMGFIEVLDNGAIYMLEIQNFIGKSTTEADRRREYDRRIAEEKKNIGEISVKSRKNLREISGEIEIEKKQKTEPEKETEQEPEPEDTYTPPRERVPYQQVVDIFNSVCTSFPSVQALNDSRKRTIKARFQTYGIEDFKKLFRKAQGSAFLRGEGGKGWQATFDWLIKDSNMTKVLEGQYDDRRSAGTGEDLYTSGLREWVEQGCPGMEEI